VTGTVLPGGDATRAPADASSVSAAVPSLVVTDLDGTFLSPDGTVSPANVDAVRRWCSSGRHFLVATGRPPRWLDCLLDLDEVHPTVIASNGAVVYDCATAEIVASHPIDPATVVEVVADVRAAVPGTSFGVEHGWRFGHEPGYHRFIDPDHEPDGIAVGHVEELVAADIVVKLLIQDHSLAPDELARRVEPIVGDRLTVTHSAANGLGLLELSATGVTKASTLAELCARFGVDRAEVAAFGDMPNDREMLTWAGHGYVMADGHPSLRDLGTVIGSNADSAVGQVISSWLADA